MVILLRKGHSKMQSEPKVSKMKLFKFILKHILILYKITSVYSLRTSTTQYFPSSVHTGAGNQEYFISTLILALASHPPTHNQCWLYQSLESSSFKISLSSLKTFSPYTKASATYSYCLLRLTANSCSTTQRTNNLMEN